MPRSILVAYGTKHGSTAEVAAAVADTLREQGYAVDLQEAHDVADVSGYDAVVVGGSIYMGRWHRDAIRLLRDHGAALGGVPLAVFGMGPVKEGAEELEGPRRQLEKGLDHVPDVHPASVAIFGGVVDPARLHFPFNRMPAADVRDWDAIRAWAVEVGGLAAGTAVTPDG